MEKAWKHNHQAYHSSKVTNNAVRLLLFYAVECGLKTVVMKRENLSSTDETYLFAKVQHDLNKLLDYLRAGKDIKITSKLILSDYKNNQRLPTSRHCFSKDLNQIWRYGGSCKEPTDEELEHELQNINNWIQGELK